MIAVSPTNTEHITEQGIEALSQALGPAGMGRFMYQFQRGSGDYTRDRDKLLGGITLDEIVELAKEEEEAPRRFENAIDTSKLTQGQIRQMGMEALLKALGLAGTNLFSLLTQKVEILSASASLGSML